MPYYRLHCVAWNERFRFLRCFDVDDAICEFGIHIYIQNAKLNTHSEHAAPSTVPQLNEKYVKKNCVITKDSTAYGVRWSSFYSFFFQSQIYVFSVQFVDVTWFFVIARRWLNVRWPVYLSAASDSLRAWKWLEYHFINPSLFLLLAIATTASCSLVFSLRPSVSQKSYVIVLTGTFFNVIDNIERDYYIVCSLWSVHNVMGSLAETVAAATPKLVPKELR